MTVRSVRAATAPYRNEAAAVRAHVALRWLSCPFDRVLDAVDGVAPSGRVLDYGCGHGALTHHLAGMMPDAKVLGVDIDAEKIAVARRVAGGSVTFEAIEPGEVPPGPWDAITVVDVLYLLREPGRGALLDALAGSLAPGGRLVIKEMSARPAIKAGWMRFQERLAVNVLRVTEGEALAFTDGSVLAARLRSSGLTVSDMRVDRGYPYPHHLIVARRLREEVPADEVGVHQRERGGARDDRSARDHEQQTSS